MPGVKTENAFSWQPGLTAGERRGGARPSAALGIARVQVSHVGLDYVRRHPLQEEPAEGESTCRGKKAKSRPLM